MIKRISQEEHRVLTYELALKQAAKQERQWMFQRGIWIATVSLATGALITQVINLALS